MSPIAVLIALAVVIISSVVWVGWNADRTMKQIRSSIDVQIQNNFTDVRTMSEGQVNVAMKDARRHVEWMTQYGIKGSIADEARLQAADNAIKLLLARRQQLVLDYGESLRA